MVPIKATATKFTSVIRFHALSPNLLPQTPKSHSYPFLPSTLNPPRKSLTKISCRKENKRENLTDDEMLAVELSLEIQKLSSLMVQREEALEKSREILFAEVCNFTGLKSEDLKNKWRKMNEDERRGLVLGFVAEWSDHFHPLSAKSVMEMVDEYLGKNNEFSDNPVSSDDFFTDLRKLLGFSGNSEE
ncbi:hypothetical protein PHJA_000827600 [Phtheirospermum japonicum]|uniref:DUF7026 domain-containing protein n=1 Tax=Phtheirospermum japonicum TaxID=374723 RepID=A0A830BPD2_9LAMI|nr:hypothetical protein PHJA_000827600 [Phtheirospermum japonicum]